ncbi:MAG: hypothetical protein WCZ11_00855 [Bacilli bacterium]
MMSLKELNNNSLSNVVLYTHNTIEDLINSLSFHNIIFTGEDIFIGIKNEFGVALTRIENIKYSNIKLNKIPVNSYFKMFLPKAPFKLYIDIFNIFNYIYKESGNELCINVYYNKSTKRFELDVIKQMITEAHVDYIFGKNENDKNYIRYLQIHSHNSMPANFSNEDNNDEKNSQFCFYGVIGNFSKNCSYIDVNYSFRIWNGIKFQKININDIFNWQGSTVSNSIKTKLDEIIKNVKIRPELSNLPQEFIDFNNNSIEKRQIDITTQLKFAEAKKFLQKKLELESYL